MRKINPLLEQTSEALTRRSSVSRTEAGRTEQAPRTGSQRSGQTSGPDLVDAINQLFAEFELAYHNQYTKAYGNEEKLSIAKKYWLGCLSQYSPVQIVKAARKVVLSQDFLPTVSAVVRACNDGRALFGLPETRQAYIEACRAPSPKSEQNWSHEAVYFAGVAAGWYILANEPEEKGLAVFSYHYDLLCERVARGESLEMPQPRALSASTSAPLSAEENQDRMRRLRAELGI